MMVKMVLLFVKAGASYGRIGNRSGGYRPLRGTGGTLQSVSFFKENFRLLRGGRRVLEMISHLKSMLSMVMKMMITPWPGRRASLSPALSAFNLSKSILTLLQAVTPSCERKLCFGDSLENIADHPAKSFVYCQLIRRKTMNESLIISRVCYNVKSS